MDGSTSSFAPLPPALAPLEILEDEIAELSAHVSAATFRLLELIAEFDRRGGWSEAGARSCAHWLNWKVGLDLGAAREKLRVAHALPALPLIGAAFARGEVSYSKVRAMTRVATPANEALLLHIAVHGTAAHVERAVRGYRREQRLADANRQHAERYVSWREDDDGCLVLRGRLPAEQGALVMRALQAAHEAVKARECAALGAACIPSDLPPDATPGAPASAGARRADALELLAETFIAHGPGELAGGERCQVVVHVSAETLRSEAVADAAAIVTPTAATAGDTALPAAPGELTAEANVSAETCRRLACDCSRVHIVANGAGRPLDVGRRTRSIPPAILRALQRRDGGCRFPGCTCTRWVDGHHVRHWADGGETKLGNLVLLCRFHHRLVHEGGFGVRVLDDGAIVFTAPDGARVPEAGAPRPVAPDGGRTLALGNARRGLVIDAMTGASRWEGERMDDGIVVEGLMRCDAAAAVGMAAAAAAPPASLPTLL